MIECKYRNEISAHSFEICVTVGELEAVTVKTRYVDENTALDELEFRINGQNVNSVNIEWLKFYNNDSCDIITLDGDKVILNGIKHFSFIEFIDYYKREF